MCFSLCWTQGFVGFFVVVFFAHVTSYGQKLPFFIPASLSCHSEKSLATCDAEAFCRGLLADKHKGQECKIADRHTLHLLLLSFSPPVGFVYELLRRATCFGWGCVWALLLQTSSAIHVWTKLTQIIIYWRLDAENVQRETIENKRNKQWLESTGKT